MISLCLRGRKAFNTMLFYDLTFKFSANNDQNNDEKSGQNCDDTG